MPIRPVLYLLTLFALLAASLAHAQTTETFTPRFIFASAETQPQYIPIAVTPDHLPKEEPAQLSPIEAMYQDRVLDDLRHYGYDMLNKTKAPITATKEPSPTIPLGAVPHDFRLNFGDELDVSFTGQRTDRGRYTINSEGLLLIKDFPAIPAAGRTLGDLRAAVQSVAAAQYNTQSYVALANVRQINVLLIGHVDKPGRKTLTVFDTVLDALIEAGGIDTQGSLRQVKLVRDGRSTFIDLYALFMHGSTNVDLALRDGDRIIVPAIGPTVAIAGEVKRPGIYEILPTTRNPFKPGRDRARAISLNEMLSLSGGTLTPGDYRFLKLSIEEGGEESVQDITAPLIPAFGDGAILMVSKGEAKRTGMVELSGHTRKPGLHALSENASLSGLLKSDQFLGRDIYPLLGLLERWDEASLTHITTDFPLRLVLSGDYDQRLQDGDTITLLSNAQIRDLKKEDARSVSLDQGSQSPAERKRRRAFSGARHLLIRAYIVHPWRGAQARLLPHQRWHHIGYGACRCRRT